MIKQRIISIYGKSKTNFYSKFFLTFGMILLILFIILHFTSLSKTLEIRSQTETILAFSIILIGIGAILYFFYYQFAKLTRIAEEIENKDELDN